MSVGRTASRRHGITSTPTRFTRSRRAPAMLRRLLANTACLLILAGHADDRLCAQTKPATSSDPVEHALAEARKLIDAGQAAAAIATLRPLDANADPRI